MKTRAKEQKNTSGSFGKVAKRPWTKKKAWLYNKVKEICLVISNFKHILLNFTLVTVTI